MRTDSLLCSGLGAAFAEGGWCISACDPPRQLTRTCAAALQLYMFERTREQQAESGRRNSYRFELITPQIRPNLRRKTSFQDNFTEDDFYLVMPSKPLLHKAYRYYAYRKRRIIRTHERPALAQACYSLSVWRAEEPEIEARRQEPRSLSQRSSSTEKKLRQQAAQISNRAAAPKYFF